MTRRDWVLAGAVYLFLGAGLSVWMTPDGIDLARTVIGGAPMLAGLAALWEFAARH